MSDDDLLRSAGTDADGAARAPRTAARSDDRGSIGRMARGLGRAVLVALGAVAAVFAVANRQRVDFSWLVGETTVVADTSGGVTGGVPLFALLLAAFGLGLLVGVLLVWRRGARSRRG